MTAALEPLLALIRQKESGEAAARKQKVPSEYEVVWGGIPVALRPQSLVSKLLTDMTCNEVLAWQDSIDPVVNSEAAGAYQFMEDTLRPMVVGMEDKLFNKETQDQLACKKLEQRGLNKFLAGAITTQQFGDSIAQEWASFPVLSEMTTKRDGTLVRRGQGFYDGDRVGNRASLAPKKVEAALAEVLALHKSPAPKPPVVIVPWWQQLIARILAKFGGTPHA